MLPFQKLVDVFKPAPSCGPALPEHRSLMAKYFRKDPWSDDGGMANFGNGPVCYLLQATVSMLNYGEKLQNDFILWLLEWRVCEDFTS